MRQRAENQEISVHAIAGTRVVLLGLNANDDAAARLLGFSISRKGEDGRWRALRGGRMFPGVASEEAAGHESPDSSEAPIQAFLWGDYVVEANQTYTYRVVPRYGTPEKMESGDAVEVTVKTEDPAGNDCVHSVYFNRGVAGSQAYSRRFGDYRRWYAVEGRDQPRQYLKPDDVPNREAYQWLSRGLEEAMLAYIAQAKDSTYKLRVAAYELSHQPVVQALADALERGVDVQIIHHAKPAPVYRLASNKNAEVTVTYKDGSQEPQTIKNREVVRDDEVFDGICETAERCIARAGFRDAKNVAAFRASITRRKLTTISHNKFIVLIKDDAPVCVWTGSTNYTAGGIFGQSNVGHVVHDAKVAAKYLEYWEHLREDPEPKSWRAWTAEQQPDLEGPPPPNSVTAVFSPRPTTAMLEWYAEQLAAGKRSVFFTAAFGVADQIYEKLVKAKRVPAAQPYLRYVLLESNPGIRKKVPKAQQGMADKCRELAKCGQNRLAWGDVLQNSVEEREQFIETLSGLNDHVEYLHTKYMIVDPLSNDPIVITGSANFSENSTTKNDENMLIIRGDTRVADIYLGEFMRIFNHFQWRNEYNKLSAEEKQSSGYLVPDASWTKPYYKPKTAQWAERLLFAC